MDNCKNSGKKWQWPELRSGKNATWGLVSHTLKHHIWWAVWKLVGRRDSSSSIYTGINHTESDKKYYECLNFKTLISKRHIAIPSEISPSLYPTMLGHLLKQLCEFSFMSVFRRCDQNYGACCCWVSSSRKAGLFSGTVWLLTLPQSQNRHETEIFWADSVHEGNHDCAIMTFTKDF